MPMEEQLILGQGQEVTTAQTKIRLLPMQQLRILALITLQ